MTDPIFPEIDTQTLALARAIIQFTLAGLVIWTGSRGGLRGAALWWAWGLALHAVSLLFFLVRYEALDPLIVAANHLTLGFSSACILIGFWRFTDQPAHRLLLFLIVAIPAVSLILWEWWMPSARWRILFTASSQLIFLVVLQTLLSRPPRQEMTGIYSVLRATTIGYALLLVWAYGSLVELLPTTARVPPGYHGVLFSVGSMLFLLALAVGVLALQYSRLACRHADQARTDWLTGLLNRRGLLAAMETSPDYTVRNESNYALLSIDIDRFKSINDNHGHAAGDQMLRSLALELLRHARDKDLVARVGGEEFQLVLPNTDAPSALALADKLRKACPELVIDTRSDKLSATISIGVATQAPGESFDDAARRADNALYQAKRAGRNRIVLAP